MRLSGSDPSVVRNPSGISDTVGAVILIAIFTTGIAIVSSHLISQAEYGEVPAVNLDLSVNGSNFAQLFHAGGDALQRDQTTIYVDGIDVTSDFINEAGDPWSSLAAGNYIEMELPEGVDADSVIVVHHFEGGGSQVIMTLGDTTIPPVPVPVADFTAGPTSGTAPLSVQFTDTSTGSPTSWSWDFGDGNTSAEQNPVHTYEIAGTYTVTLAAANAYGSDTETKTDYITVSEPLPSVIFFDDFEDGNYDGWTKTWDFIYMTSSPAIGNYAVELVKYGDMERIIPTTGYTGINVSFWMGAYKLEKTESVRAYWTSDGSNWNLLKQINNGDPEEDGRLHFFSFELPASADNNPDFGLRFGIWGSGKRDYGYVDNVRVEGT